MLRVALVSRDVHPVSRGGIGMYVSALASMLASTAEVTVVTTDAHEEELGALRAAGDPRLPPASVRFAYVPEVQPEEVGTYFAFWHVWSARVYQALRDLYADGGPDVIEFPDYFGEAAVTVQGKRAGDRWLRDTLVAVRLHTSVEIVSVLDGYVGHEMETEMAFELERYALRFADRILAASPRVYSLYERFYGAGALVPMVAIPHPMPGQWGPPDEPIRSDDGLLRLLYLGRLERRKGVANLIRAATSLGRDDWRLLLVGSDTDTAPLGGSMRSQLERTVGDDPRIAFADEVAQTGVAGLWRQHDLGIFPSLWECWPTTLLECLHSGRPAIATPVGGHLDMVRPGRSGWLTADREPEAVARGIEHVLEHREQLEAIGESGGPARVAAELTDAETIREGYSRLHRLAPAPPPRRRRTSPLVSVVIPYFEMEEFIADTVTSVFEQTHDPLEVVLINDGSFRQEDWILASLATEYPLTVLTQPNAGLSAARNFGVSQSRGLYVLPLDADNMIEPAFVARCVDVLERDRDVAYVTSWSRYIDAEGQPLTGPDGGYQPLGNSPRALDRGNVAGDAAAVIRRSVFARLRYAPDLRSYEDWMLYRQMREAGLIGHVIPERLLVYRLRDDSMLRTTGLPQTARLDGEMRAHLKEQEVQWTS